MRLDRQFGKYCSMSASLAIGSTRNVLLQGANHRWDSLLARGVSFSSVSEGKSLMWQHRNWLQNKCVGATGKAQQERLGSYVCPSAKTVNMGVSKVLPSWTPPQRIIKSNLIWVIREKAKAGNWSPAKPFSKESTDYVSVFHREIKSQVMFEDTCGVTWIFQSLQDPITIPLLAPSFLLCCLGTWERDYWKLVPVSSVFFASLIRLM